MKLHRDDLHWIFLHGLGDGPDSAEQLLGMLRRDGGRVVAPDLNEVWRNSRADITTTVDRLANSLRDNVLGDVSPQGCIVAGHSAGALVALALAEAEPSVRGLVLLEGSFRPADAEVVARYVDAPDEQLDCGRQRLIAELRRQELECPAARRYLANVAATDPLLFQGLARDIVRHLADHRDRLAALSLPVLYIAGGASPGAAAVADLTAALGPSVTAVTIYGAAHWVQEYAPAEVFQAMRDWLRDWTG